MSSSENITTSKSLGLSTNLVRPDPAHQDISQDIQYAWPTQSSLKRKSKKFDHNDSIMLQVAGYQAWCDDVRCPSTDSFRSHVHAQRASRLLRAPARASQSNSPPRSLSYLKHESSRDSRAPIVQSVSRIPRVPRDGQCRCTPVHESQFHAEASRKTAREIRRNTTFCLPLPPVRNYG
jgi:hypothetical protein